jgi:N-acetylmuramoyl-L-alanine amidase
MLRYGWRGDFIGAGLCLAGITFALSSSAATNSAVPTVVIDAGHGGFDRGGIPGQRVDEKMVTLDVAQRLKSVLAANGYRVVMTRDADVFVPLGTRVAVANSYPNAIFVCIHFNSARRMGANGIETYFFSRQSLPLASAIHYYVAGGAPSMNRGVRRRGYYVLRHTAVPSVLIECGFLTNPTEAQYAQTVSYRQQLAEEIARGVRVSSSVVATSSSGTARLANAEAVPLQPFIDQTHVRDPDISPSKGSKRGSRSRTKHKKASHVSRSEDAATTNKSNDSDITRTRNTTRQHLDD